MQTIYIDVLIFTNMFEDFLFLLCTKRILHLNVKYYRIIIGSLFGGLTSLLALFDNYGFIISLLIKLASASAMVIITFGFKNKRLFIKTSFTLFLVSFLVTGGLICFYFAMKPSKMEIINDTVYFNISPVLLIILTLAVYFILLIYKRLFKNHTKPSQICNVEIRLKNISIDFRCKCDSGCNVKEPFSGSSVIIAEKALLKGLDLNNVTKRVIPFDSLGGSGIIFGFVPDKVIIDDIEQEEEIYIGVCENILKSEIKALIPENLTRG